MLIWGKKREKEGLIFMIRTFPPLSFFNSYIKKREYQEERKK